MSELDDEMVYLSIGPEYDDGEILPRAQLPTDALLSAVEIDGTNLEGGEPRMYTVYTIER